MEEDKEVKLFNTIYNIQGLLVALLIFTVLMHIIIYYNIDSSITRLNRKLDYVMQAVGPERSGYWKI